MLTPSPPGARSPQGLEARPCSVSRTRGARTPPRRDTPTPPRQPGRQLEQRAGLGGAEAEAGSSTTAQVGSHGTQLQRAASCRRARGARGHVPWLADTGTGTTRQLESALPSTPRKKKCPSFPPAHEPSRNDNNQRHSLNQKAGPKGLLGCLLC